VSEKVEINLYKNKREGCGGCGERSEPQHCPEERSDEGIAEAEAKPEAARPERATATRRCEGVARSNLLLGNINSF